MNTPLKAACVSISEDVDLAAPAKFRVEFFEESGDIQPFAVEPNHVQQGFLGVIHVGKELDVLGDGRHLPVGQERIDLLAVRGHNQGFMPVHDPPAFFGSLAAALAM